jgi:hypothetical protein
MQLYPKTGKHSEKTHADKDLTFLANLYEADKGDADPKTLSWGNNFPNHTTMGYTKTYEKYMNPKKNHPVTLMEVGIADHRFPFASVKMWVQYFSDIELYSIDNFWGRSFSKKNIASINSMGCNFIYADQGSESDWLEIKKNIPNNSVDFFIEDGSHQPNHMCLTLYHSCDIVKSGGYYFMEDIQSRRMPKFIFDSYDHEILTKEIIDSYDKKSYRSTYLTEDQNNKINESYNLIELVLDERDTNHLAVFQKK